MSLLLEALKKAEKAKEEAQRRAKGEPAVASAPLQLQEDAPRAEPRADAKTVLTRAELPDISAPLEILSDDFGSRGRSGAAEAKGPFAGARAAQVRPQASAGEPGDAPAREAAQQTERSAARKVFEAKFKEPDPRLAFFVTLGALGVFALGIVGYFWYQLRPPASLVNLRPAQTAPRDPIASAPVVAIPPTPAASAALPSSSTIPGLPATSPAAATVRPPSSATPAIPRTAPPPRFADPAPLAAASERPQPSLRASASAAARDPQPAPGRPAPQVHPKVQAAYAAYVAGDIDTARADYMDALREDPASRDALLGLAAVDVRSGRFEAAEATYLKLLRADPRDPHAQAAIIALRGARQDPLVTESRLKNLLAADPGAHVLNFALGNQLAQQGRWSEAQQEYFKAFASEPDNADFAYNLAVSLDHLRQPKLALEYYQRALALLAKRGASFDAAAARERVAQLGGK